MPPRGSSFVPPRGSGFRASEEVFVRASGDACVPLCGTSRVVSALPCHGSGVWFLGGSCFEGVFVRAAEEVFVRASEGVCVSCLRGGLCSSGPLGGGRASGTQLLRGPLGSGSARAGDRGRALPGQERAKGHETRRSGAESRGTGCKHPGFSLKPRQQRKLQRA